MPSVKENSKSPRTPHGTALHLAWQSDTMWWGSKQSACKTSLMLSIPLNAGGGRPRSLDDVLGIFNHKDSKVKESNPALPMYNQSNQTTTEERLVTYIMYDTCIYVMTNHNVPSRSASQQSRARPLRCGCNSSTGTLHFFEREQRRRRPKLRPAAA